MKINIYNPKPEEKKEKELNLKLIPYCGGVSLVAVDENGKEISSGHILHVTEKGIIRNSFVNRDLGLPLDGLSRVRFRGESD